MQYKNLKALLAKRFSIPKERSVRRVVRRFTIAEKAVFYFFVGIFLLSGLALLVKVNNQFLLEIPIRGGTLTEGVVGNPRFINPVLAISDADKNLTALVYSGLVRATAEGGIENDLADLIDISPDGLTYTVHINEDMRFHDSAVVTADDVIFTIQKVTDPLIKSPKRGNWDGVTISKLDDYTIRFQLKKPYAPFMDNLTLGILPRHIWKNVSNEEFTFSQFNTLPIGSGPYRVESVERNPGGIPNHYRLVPFDEVAGQAPYIKNLVFKFYPSEEELLGAYRGGDIESFGGLSPENESLIKNGSRIASSPLPRVFAAFFNQSQSQVLRDKQVRQALDLAAPREEIVEEVLGGYGTPIDGPLPAGIFPWTAAPQDKAYEERFQEAASILANAGWIMDNETGLLEKKSGSSTIQMLFTISTGDAPELRAVAEILSSAWRRLGAMAEVKVFESGDLNQNVIRPRNFDALLFGEVVGRDADVYPFWHSSQRADPGLNIALYANNRADRLLELARGTIERDEREGNYKDFYSEIKADIPAVFLYTPSYLYVLPDKVKQAEMGSLAASQDRFLDIRNWYIDTDKVWKIFID